MIEQPEIFSSFFAIGKEIIFYVVVFFFIFYAVALAYHWFSYGTAQKTAMLSLAVFLIVSAPLLLTMALTI